MKPEGSNVSYRDLAERFYALDTEVYKASGSELGKVFPGPKHISEKQILKDFLHFLWNVYSEKMMEADGRRMNLNFCMSCREVTE